MEQSYKEKYEQAIERLKQWDREHPCAGYVLSDRDKFIFPELGESESEKIKKRITLCLEECVHSDVIRDYEKDECIAWLENIQYTIDHEKREGFHLGYKACLERQGEQKFEMKTAEESLGISSDEYNKIVDECLFGEQKLTEFERGLFDMLTDISNPCTADCVKAHSEKLLSIARKMIALEQKPEENNGNIGGISSNSAWNEEDEQRLNSCLNILQAKTFVGNTETINTKWLKSLKGRVQPKPLYKFGDTELTEEEVCEGLIRGMVNEHNRVTKEVLRNEYEKGRADVLAKIDAIDVDEMVCESGATSRVTQYWYAHGVNDVIKKLKEEQA